MNIFIYDPWLQRRLLFYIQRDLFGKSMIFNGDKYQKGVSLIMVNKRCF